MDLSPIPGTPAELPPLAEDAVQVRVMRELFRRTRESALVGLLPVGLIVWSHWAAQPVEQLLLWTACTLAVLGYRVVVSHLYLADPQRESARLQTWYRLEWLGALGLAAVWAGSLTLIGTGEVDSLLYLRLVFIVALMAFVLSAMGIQMLLYASFMIALSGGMLVQLHLYYPDFVRELPIVDVAVVAYVVMLLIRSRSEQRRTMEWVRARLTQRVLLDQLNQNIRQELIMHEALRLKTLELESTNHKLGELAIRDGLTGAYRRGHIESELRRAVMSMHRHPGNFSIQLMDVDHFKLVNDVHGHMVGDEVLRRIAALAQETVRGNDLFGRWGGEEFIVLLPDTALPQALEAAERLRAAVQRLEFTNEGSVPFNVTISVGVAQLQADESAESLTERADKALYAAKHAGRNRVLAYEPGQSQFVPLG